MRTALGRFKSRHASRFELELSYVIRDLEGGGLIEVEQTSAGENLTLTPSGFERQKIVAARTKRKR